MYRLGVWTARGVGPVGRASQQVPLIISNFPILITRSRFERCRTRGRGLILRTRIKRMLALFIEFVLKLEALVVGLCSANGFDDGGNPIVHVPFAEFARGDRTVSGVVVGKAGVPPDAGVYIFGQGRAFLVAAGFGVRAFAVNQLVPRDH